MDNSMSARALGYLNCQSVYFRRVSCYYLHIVKTLLAVDGSVHSLQQNGLAGCLSISDQVDMS